MRDSLPDQDAPEDALLWPEDYLEEGRWKRFFVGVRWLGSDVSLFRELRNRQAARTVGLMMAWGNDPRRRRGAEVLGRAFQRHLRWPTAYFLPSDEFRAVAAGPRLSLVDHGDLDCAVKEIELQLDGPASDGFWARAQGMTLGDVVDDYLQISRAS